MRSLLRLLFRTARQADIAVPAIVVGDSPIAFDAPTVIAFDSGEPPAPPPSNSTEVTVQNDEFAAIEYEDAAGNCTRRRITIHQTNKENGTIYVHAYCHERRVPRTFRADRIRAFITTDGEVIPGHEFLAQRLGIQMAPAPSAQQREGIVIGRIKRQLRDPLTILVGLAACDGNVHPDEIDAIQIFAEREILKRHRSEVFSDVPVLRTLNGLCQAIGMMRPRAPTLATAIDRMSGYAPNEIEDFLKTVAKVVRADGRIAAEEADFLEMLRQLFTAESAVRLDLITSELRAIMD